MKPVKIYIILLCFCMFLPNIQTARCYYDDEIITCAEKSGLFNNPPCAYLPSNSNDGGGYLIYRYSDIIEFRDVMSNIPVLTLNISFPNTGDVIYDRLFNRIYYVTKNKDKYVTVVIDANLDIKHYESNSSLVFFTGIDKYVSIVSKFTDNSNDRIFEIYLDNKKVWSKSDICLFYFDRYFLICDYNENTTSVVDPLTGNPIKTMEGIWYLNYRLDDFAVLRPPQPQKRTDGKFFMKIFSFKDLKDVMITTPSYAYSNVFRNNMYVWYSTQNNKNDNYNTKIYVMKYANNCDKLEENEIDLPCDYNSILQLPVKAILDDNVVLWSTLKCETYIYNTKSKTNSYVLSIMNPYIKIYKDLFLIVSLSNTSIFDKDCQMINSFETVTSKNTIVNDNNLYVVGAIYDQESLTNVVQKVRIINLMKHNIDSFTFEINPGLTDYNSTLSNRTILPTKYGLLSIPFSDKYKGFGIRLYKYGHKQPSYSILKNPLFFISSYKLSEDGRFLNIECSELKMNLILDIKEGIVQNVAKTQIPSFGNQ